jgi:hypothetical protein
LGFSGLPSGIEDWGKFQVSGEEFVFSFDELQKGISRKGLLFQTVYDNALILRVTRISDGTMAQARYVDLIEALFRLGPKIRLAGIDFAVFVESGSAIPPSVYLVEDRSWGGRWAYRIYLRDGVLAGNRIVWFFSEDGLSYGVRPEGGQIVFYSRPGLVEARHGFARDFRF